MAVFMIYSYITSKEQEIKDKYGTEAPVIVATKNIAEMVEIAPTMIEVVNKPQRFLEPGRATTKKEVEGFIAMVPISKGEQITFNKIIQVGVKTGLSKQVTPGKRAISIPVDDNRSVNRLLKPGDRIDLLATIDPPGGQKGSQLTKIVAQDIPVIAVGEYISTTAPRKIVTDEVSGKQVSQDLRTDRTYNTITIEVDPQAAVQISLLRDGSTILSTMLRNSDDTDRLNIPAMNLLDVLGPDQSKIIRAPAAQR